MPKGTGRRIVSEGLVEKRKGHPGEECDSITRRHSVEIGACTALDSVCGRTRCAGIRGLNHVQEPGVRRVILDQRGGDRTFADDVDILADRRTIMDVDSDSLDTLDYDVVIFFD